VRNLQGYAESHGILVEIVSGPDWATDDTGWEHWAYTLNVTNRSRGTSFTTPWKQGVLVTQDPDGDPAMILDDMIKTHWGYVCAGGFEDWAMDYGYDPDSRRAEALYNEIAAQHEAILIFLGGADELERLATTYEGL
jgi:hypothetical protein